MLSHTQPLIPFCSYELKLNFYPFLFGKGINLHLSKKAQLLASLLQPEKVRTQVISDVLVQENYSTHFLVTECTLLVEGQYEHQRDIVLHGSFFPLFR